MSIQNTWPQLQKKIVNRRLMTFGIGWVADYPDAENFLQLLYGPNRPPGPNGSGHNNPTFNKLFQRAATMQDSPKRTALYKKLNTMATESVPWILGLHRQHYTIKHGWVKNFISTDFEGDQSSYLDVDLSAKKAILPKL